jgi:hypothetical protein
MTPTPLNHSRYWRMACYVLAIESTKLSTVLQPLFHIAFGQRQRINLTMGQSIFIEMPVEHLRKHELSHKFPVKESPDLADTAGRRPEAASATVYLEVHAMERIKQVCREENRRISDVISEAVDIYLREHTKFAFERTTDPDSE